MDPYGATDNCSFDIGCSFIKRRYLFSPGKKTWNTDPCGVAFANVMRLHAIQRL